MLRLVFVSTHYSGGTRTVKKKCDNLKNMLKSYVLFPSSLWRFYKHFMDKNHVFLEFSV